MPAKTSHQADEVDFWKTGTMQALQAGRMIAERAAKLEAALRIYADPGLWRGRVFKAEMPATDGGAFARDTLARLASPEPEALAVLRTIAEAARLLVVDDHWIREAGLPQVFVRAVQDWAAIVARIPALDSTKQGDSEDGHRDDRSGSGRDARGDTNPGDCRDCHGRGADYDGSPCDACGGTGDTPGHPGPAPERAFDCSCPESDPPDPDCPAHCELPF